VRSLFLLIFSLFSLLAEPLPEYENSFSPKIQTLLLDSLQKGDSKTHLKKNNIYSIKKGWNSFTTSKSGIDVIKTFENLPAVKFVVTYDFQSNYWAGFTLNQSILKDIKEMLLLRSLEPNTHFFILSDKEFTLTIESNIPRGECAALQENPHFLAVQNSALASTPTEDNKRNISITSRYHSHTYRGYYDDTRVLLFYPKIKTTSKKILHYGPAEPFVHLEYAKEYEDKTFYIYDYLLKKCYRGTFPSKKMPPFPTLQILE
jgi:hypothetical protein